MSGTSESTPFVLGANYWPRRKAMRWWSDFDGSEVAEDFALMAELGMSVVRVFLLWDDWQPDPSTVSPERLADLRTVADLAVGHGLGLDVTFFTGHMSGPNWSPRWLLSNTAPPPSPHVMQVVSRGKVVAGAYRNPFSDSQALSAQRLLLSTVVRELSDHPGVWMWNLGNEPDLFAHPATESEGQGWVRSMTELIRQHDPVRPVTCGLHTASLFENNHLRVDQVFAETDVAVMHGYPMYVPWARSPLDPDFVPFLCALTSALSGKPTLAEEWGGCTAPPGKESETWEWTSYGDRRRTQFMAGEVEFGEYVAEVLPKLVEVGSTGSLMWCFADYIPELWNEPPCDLAIHERHFGLVRPDGSVKPHAEAIKKFAATGPVVEPARRTIELDITPDQYYASPVYQAERLYRRFV